MLYMVWNLIKLAFQRNQPHVFWNFQDGVIAKTLKTAQKTNSHAETTQKLFSWKLVHIAYPFFSFSCLYLSRRVVPSINIHVLLSKRRLLIIEIQNPLLFSCVLTNIESDLYPFALVISFMGFTEAAASSAPNWCSYSLRGLPWLIVGCVGWFLESVVGRILDSGCQLKTVVGFEFYLPGCTSYRCLQQVIRLFFS